MLLRPMPLRPEKETKTQIEILSLIPFPIPFPIPILILIKILIMIVIVILGGGREDIQGGPEGWGPEARISMPERRGAKAPSSGLNVGLSVLVVWALWVQKIWPKSVWPKLVKGNFNDVLNFGHFGAALPGNPFDHPQNVRNT